MQLGGLDLGRKTKPLGETRPGHLKLVGRVSSKSLCAENGHQIKAALTLRVGLVEAVSRLHGGTNKERNQKDKP